MIVSVISSLRARLLLLVLLAVLPAFGLIAYGAWEQRLSSADEPTVIAQYGASMSDSPDAKVGAVRPNADASRILRRNLFVLALTAALAFTAAWFGGDLFILRQVNALLDATKRFAYGDLYGRTRLTYSAKELRQLSQSFDAMGVALHAREDELRRSKEEAQQNLERIRALHEINLAINSILDLRHVADVLLEKVDCFFAYPTVATIGLVNNGTGDLEPLACRNRDPSAWQAEQARYGRGLTNVVATTRAPLAVEAVDAYPGTDDAEFFRRHNLVSFLGVPLIAKEILLGVLSIYTKEKHRFTEEEIGLLVTLGGQAAIAINNSRLYEETKKRAVASDAANKLKGDFLSVMSHELRTPLAVAMGYAGMLKERVLGEINPPQRDALEKILRQGHDQLYMINSILYAASLHADAVKVERTVVNLRDMLDDLQAAYAVLLEKKITLAWDYPAELPVVRTDARKLKHILENLINNAIKFTDKGGVTVSARVISEPRAVEFKVSDTGIGISEDSLQVVFEMFRQGDGVEKRLHGGVGLGLYIVKQFTELLGGKAEVESEQGRGSAFTITLPYQEAEQTGADSQTLSSATWAA